MMHNDELAARYPDLLPAFGENQPGDRELALLIADLDSLSGAPPPPPELEERIAAALQLQAAQIRLAAPARRSRELVTIEPAYLRLTEGGGEAGRGGEAIMTPRRITTIAATVAAVLVVSLIGILLYSIHGAGTGGAGAFQQRLLDLGGTQLVLGRSAGTALTPPISADIPTIEHRLADRIDPADTLVVVDSASGYLIIYIAGRTSGLQQVFSLVGTTGEIDIIDTASTPLAVGTDVTSQTCTTACASGQYQIVFTGAEMNPDSISATTDPQTNQPVVQFEFQGSAQSAFATYTQNNVGNYLTITLDNKVIESATINSQITGRAEIGGGNMTVADAQKLATLLKYRPLAVPLKVVSVTSFQPGTPAPTVVSCPTPTPTPTPIPPAQSAPTATTGTTMQPTATATPPVTPTPSAGASGATSSTPTSVAEATPAGPESTCATPTPLPTPTVIPPATPSGTLTPTPVAP